MRVVKYLVLIAFITALAGSCRKIEQLPPEPSIEFQSFRVFDTTDILGNRCKGGQLSFTFQDGDGNLGLISADKTGGDTTNLFFTLYRKENGIMKEVPDNDLMKPSSYRIPYMTRTGQNKILKGTISVTFLYLFYSTADNDTIRYDFRLKDRSDNFSNTASTCEIALSFNDLYKN